MADEIPPAPSESADEAAKAETIRITLPAKPETPTAKRETVRINLPGKSGITPIPPAGVSPKKETTKLSAGLAAPPAAEGETQAEPSRPFVPPPPKPPSQSAAPIPPSRPMSGAVPPKPPSLSKPTVPLKPAPGPGASGVRPAPGAPMKPAASGVQSLEPMAQKAAAPKKETARITLPPEGTKPVMPKATMKMQQTQPLVRQPVPSTIQTAPAIQTTPTSTTSSEAPDTTMNVLAIAAFILSLAAAFFAYTVYAGSSLS